MNNDTTEATTSLRIKTPIFLFFNFLIIYVCMYSIDVNISYAFRAFLCKEYFYRYNDFNIVILMFLMLHFNIVRLSKFYIEIERNKYPQSVAIEQLSKTNSFVPSESTWKAVKPLSNLTFSLSTTNTVNSHCHSGEDKHTVYSHCHSGENRRLTLFFLLFT